MNGRSLPLASDWHGPRSLIAGPCQVEDVHPRSASSRMEREDLGGTAVADELAQQLAVIPRSVQECVVRDEPAHARVVRSVGEPGERVSGLIRVEESASPLGSITRSSGEAFAHQPFARLTIAGKARVDRGRQGRG